MLVTDKITQRAVEKMKRQKGNPFGDLQYNRGFGNDFESECLPNALPKRGNNPQQCNYGLYAEQLSGTAFTLPRHRNQKSWLYRILPPVVHEKYQKEDALDIVNDFADCTLTPQQMRWNPMPLVEGDKVHFIQGWHTIGRAMDML